MTDLSGFWVGVYEYPRNDLNITDKTVKFNAVLQDDGGALSGEICENVTNIPDHDGLLFASIVGQHIDAYVSFIKTYENASEMYTTVIYEGVLRDNESYIKGTWTVTGEYGWSGQFVMCRAKSDSQEISIERKEHQLLTV